MQINGFRPNWPGFAAVDRKTDAAAGAPAEPSTDGQNPTSAAEGAQAAAPPPAAPPLAFGSVIDALLNSQFQHSGLVFAADGRPDMLATLKAGQPKPGGASGDSGPGFAVMSHSTDGSTDATSLSGYSDDEVAANLICQASSNSGLSLTDVLRKMHIDTATQAGRDVAEGVAYAWGKLTYGQGGSLSAADLASAIHSYRSANGDEIGAGGAAWVGRKA